jgi:glycine/D-amino acid oxidase-like deaminating enzyme
VPSTLALQVGDKIPLDTERGYHIEFEMNVPLLTRPVSPIDLGFYLTPMVGRLRRGHSRAWQPRRAGQSGANRPPRARRTQDIPQSRTWLGFRPSLPDSLPVIGCSRHCGNLIHAFGHGHLGMTLAGITSQAVAGLIERRNDVPDLSAFAPNRFV